MSMPSRGYVKRALLWLVTTTAVYLLMNGAQIFETLLIVPAWTAAPPASLGLFQGAYGLDFKAFWIVFHSLHEITFILALAVCWKLKTVRHWLLALLVVHMAVRVWTLAYFAPTIIRFQSISPSPGVDPALIQEAARWRTLNLVRVALFMAVNLALLRPIYRVANMLSASPGPRRHEPPTRGEAVARSP
jgi:hypothetical protein